MQKKLFRSLDEVAGSTQFANFLLLGTQGNGVIDQENAEIALDQSWTLEDAGIEIKELRETEEWSVRTRQVFLSDGLVEQARKAGEDSYGVLTYLVNAIETEMDGNHSSLIPYSMMSAVEPNKVDFLGEDQEMAFPFCMEHTKLPKNLIKSNFPYIYQVLICYFCYLKMINYHIL